MEPSVSNNNEDMFEEMDFAAKKLQKVARMDSRALPPAGCRHGDDHWAKALHMDKLIGLLDGKKADLIIVDATAPHATPMYNVYSALVYSLKASDVRSVVIGGKTVMEDRKMLTLNQPEILAKAQLYKSQIQQSLRAPAKN